MIPADVQTSVIRCWASASSATERRVPPARVSGRATKKLNAEAMMVRERLTPDDHQDTLEAAGKMLGLGATVGVLLVRWSGRDAQHGERDQSSADVDEGLESIREESD
jgi:hypothetical protein